MSEELRRIFRTLTPYLPDVVVIGGWVPHLYRRFGGTEWRTIPSHTNEADILVGPKVDPAGRPKIRELLEGARLRPARKEYFPADWVAEDSDVTAVEFLTPRPGPMNDVSPRMIDGQGYLGAIVLDDAEVLRDHTTVLNVAFDDERWEVRVPTLGAWAISKALTFNARLTRDDASPADDKRAKDLVYLRDVIFAGPQVLQQVQRDCREIAMSERGRRAIQRAISKLDAPHETPLHNAALRLAERDGKPAVSARNELVSSERTFGDMLQGTLDAPR